MKYLRFLFSGWFMGILLLTFATVIGYATFIENDFGASAARLMVYNTRWFEFLLLLMVLNFGGMIFTKHLYLKSKLNILLIHLALVIIIIGAGITRYWGYEGQMHIRNGQTSNQFRSADTYLFVTLEEEENGGKYEEKVLLAPFDKTIFSKKITWQNKLVEITIDGYMPQARQELVPAEQGPAYINIVAGGPDGRHEFSLVSGQSKILHDLGISFNDTSRSSFIHIISRGDSLFMRFPGRMQVAVDDGNEAPSTFEVEGFIPLQEMTVHTLGATSFVVKQFVPHGELRYRPVKNDQEHGLPVVKLAVNGQQQQVPLGTPARFSADGLPVTLQVGYKMLTLPFALQLLRFELERYPGSNSPSSYASEVVVIDSANALEMPYRIYMNHILNYRGYRFFQSSYDQDEQGTILSVNHDFWGTLVSYIGYFLLFASLLATFILKNSRFHRISMQLKEVHASRKAGKAAALAIMLLLPLSGQSQDIDHRHAQRFGQLLVQSKEGRIEPVNTMATKVLVKISKKNSYHGLTPDQVVLGMLTNPQKWQHEAIIKVPEEALQALLDIRGDYAAFVDFVDKDGRYKIRSEVEQAYQKKPALRTQFDKALINVDERVNVCYMVLNGSLLRIFPIPGHPDDMWVTPAEHHHHLGHGAPNADLFENYTTNLQQALQTGNYQPADSSLARIKAYQRQNGGHIMPAPAKVKLEILYNRINVFKTLFPVYLLLGAVLVTLFFMQIFKPQLEFNRTTQALYILLLVAFGLQTAGLATRWYISGHAPWSNGYESMIYISWATVLAGILFRKRSPITLGITALLAGITLLTAHMSWLNPEITNLVPVLKSYWLTLHVATITASYGFLALGGMIALFNLVMMIFRNRHNQNTVNATLRELSLVVELTLSAGLVLLVIGNFLGGIWANESWGRYWGWDPKETWTLVTIILYTFTLHLTLIPSLRDHFTFNFFAFASFGAVLMTYFGVNYYLSGLHSYAGGDPMPVPAGLYYALVVVGVISILAAYNEFNLKKMKTGSDSYTED